MGHSGWVGYELFVGYSQILSSRNSRLLSQKSRGSMITQSHYEGSVDLIGYEEQS